MESIHQRLTEKSTLEEAAEETNQDAGGHHNTVVRALFCDIKMYLRISDFRMPYFLYVSGSVIGFSVLSLGITASESYVEPLWNELISVYLFLTVMHHYSDVYKKPSEHDD